MTITMYVNWREEVVLNETQYAEKQEENARIRSDDSYYFNEFLEENYSPAEIFNLSEEDKKKVLDDWLNVCFEQADDEMCEDYEEITMEI